MIAGVLFVIESYRLAPLRMRGTVGDDTFPLVLGLVAISLGVVQAFFVQTKPSAMALPSGKTRYRVIGAFVVLVVYWALIPALGYTLATFACSTALFKIFGFYRWPISLLFSIILTSFLYCVFIWFLSMPFPQGVWVT